MIGAVMGFADYIRDLMKYGKCSFTLEQVQTALKKSRKAILSSIEHLVAKGELASPARGFYAIVPPEYQVLGCIPAEQFIPYLMEYWGCRYYAGLLTAAAYHGASHQAVMIFQTIIEKPRSPIICGRVKIQFIANRHLSKTPTQVIATRMGMLTVATPEGTAMDLLNYPQQSGGLNHIATVLTELQETMTIDKLRILIENKSALAWKQRLGYLLELVGANELAEVIKEYLVKQKRVDYIPLMPGLKELPNASRNSTWKIIENTTVESDI